MSMRAAFSKTMGSFDRLELDSVRDSDWLTISVHVGNDVQTDSFTLRSDEAVRDLHYALGRYLEHIKTTP